MTLIIYRTILSNSHFKFLSQKYLSDENDQNSHFYFENFNFNFFIFFFKFETLSPKLHLLTLNPKSRLVNPRVKIHFYPLIKFILVIFFSLIFSPYFFFHWLFHVSVQFSYDYFIKRWVLFHFRKLFHITLSHFALQKLYGQFSQISLLSFFCQKNSRQKRKWPKWSLFILKILILNFLFF